MKSQTAVFAAGCFWGVEESFRKLKGVLSTRVGYMGGKTKHPTYKEVCAGNTNHAEAIEIKFNQDEISYEKLLEIFLKVHNPTTINRQGFDFGSQYRSAIFYTNEKQKKIAELYKKKMQKNFKEKIVTEIKPESVFYPAEEYHQKYLMKQGKASCHI